MKSRYDQIGRKYAKRRLPDSRIGAQIEAALGDARSVLNVGAGTGSYEPISLHGIALEPSSVMISQRPSTAFPVVRGYAETLPFADQCVDAVMAVMTLHHWSDVALGLSELMRVARDTVVIMTFDPSHEGFWLDDYLPSRRTLDQTDMPSLEIIRDTLGSADIEVVPVPHDCCDGFYGAYWRRPHAYLDPSVRDGISVFSRLADVDQSLEILSADLNDGNWYARYGSILELEVLDVGYRLVIAKVS